MSVYDFTIVLPRRKGLYLLIILIVYWVKVFTNRWWWLGMWFCYDFHLCLSESRDMLIGSGKRDIVLWIIEQGPISLTVFPSQFKFNGNFVALSPRFWYSDRYKILYMAWQLCCHGMCKTLLRSDGQQRNYSQAKFPSNFNCGQKIVGETWPVPV